jgi:hypothetical protein
MLSRWRRALASDDAFAQALDGARHRAVRICEQQKIGTIRGTEERRLGSLESVEH